MSELTALRRLGGFGVAGRYSVSLLRHAPAVVRGGTLAPVDAAMAGRPWSFTVDGREVAFDGYSFGVARELYGRRAYFAAAGFAIRPGDTVLDLGANAGLFSILAARLGARVVAVEANPACLELLASNIRRNGGEGAVVVEHALVGGGSGLFKGGTLAPGVTVEELVRRHSLERIDFLKVDIEGSEYDLFASGGQWLDCVRLLAMEVHPEHGDPVELAHVLREAGFQLELRDADLHRVAAIGPPAGFLYGWRA